MKMQIIIRLSLIAFCVSMMIASAKAGMKEGISWYDNRHQDSKGFIASKINIDKAINEFKTALSSPLENKEAALYLLKSYYYKAEFTTSKIEEKKLIFNEGKALGKEYINKYPNSIEYKYWYLVNLGSWAKVYGIITAAREGVADQMKTFSEDIIKLNPIYKDGAGYFMLGAVHYKSPYIPFLLSWPDNNEAIKYLQLAHDTGKATLNQKNYLAQAIHKDGQIVKAKKLLNDVINSSPDPNNLVEELDDINEAKNILKTF